MKKRWHVVAGVLTNLPSSKMNEFELPCADAVPAASGDLKVLIAERPAGKSHAGLWEFPGGKCEVGEAALQALRRELQEEVAVTIKSASPLVSRYYDYDDYSIFLQSWLVHDYLGEPKPLEG